MHTRVAFLVVALAAATPSLAEEGGEAGASAADIGLGSAPAYGGAQATDAPAPGIAAEPPQPDKPAEAEGTSAPEPEKGGTAGASASDIGLGPPVSATEEEARREDVREHAGQTAAKQFIKGELAQIGSSKLVGRKNRFGARMGYEQIGEVRYLKPTFELDLRIGKFGLGLGVPGLFELCRGPMSLGVPPCDTSRPDGLFRLKTYDEPSDYAQILRYLTYGRKESNLYLNVSQLYAATIGHGPILRRYFANADVDTAKVGVQFDAYGDYGGFEFFTGNVIRPQDLVAALVFIKPWSLFSDTVMAKSLSIGVTYAADLAAPVEVKRDDAGQPVVTDTGDLEAARTTRVQAIGVDAEIKVVKTESADIKPFIDYSKIVGAGGGVTLGALGRFNFGADPVHAFRLIAEVRTFDDNYRPSYFDTFYEIQKWQYITGPSSASLPTKWTWLTSQRGPRRFGYYLEGTYSPVGYIALSAALEQSNAAAGNNFLIHVEVPASDWLKFFATYHRRGFEGKFFDWKEDNNLLYAAARMKILPILFVNARYYRTFQMDPGSRAYKNVTGWDIDAELGLEFGESFESQ